MQPYTPPQQTGDFSYESNVAPYADKFFGEIGSNSDLSHEAKIRLQGQLIGESENIEKERLDLQARRSSLRVNNLRYQQGVSAMEQARAETRLRDQLTAETSQLQGQILSIASDESMSETERRQKLDELQLTHPYGARPEVGRLFAVGRDRVPKPKEAKSAFTPTQVVDFLAKDVTPDALNNPILLAQQLKDYESKKAAQEQAGKEAGAAEKERSKFREKFMFEDFSMAKDEFGIPTGELDPESYNKGVQTIEVLADPEDRESLLSAYEEASGTEKIAIISQLQNKELKARVSEAPAASTESKQKVIADHLTGGGS